MLTKYVILDTDDGEYLLLNISLNIFDILPVDIPFEYIDVINSSRLTDLLLSIIALWNLLFIFSDLINP